MPTMSAGGVYTQFVLCCQDYLVRFGYLGDDANPGEELRYHQDEKFAQAVRRFQEFAGLNVTGKREFIYARADKFEH